MEDEQREMPRKRTLVAHADRIKIRVLHQIAGWAIARHFNRAPSTIASILALPRDWPQHRRSTTICIMDTPTRQRAVRLATSSTDYRRMPWSALKMEMGIQCSDKTFMRAIRLGLIGEHNVVLAYMSGMGTTSAAAVAGSLCVSFPSIKLALVVSICGGMPSGAD